GAGRCPTPPADLLRRVRMLGLIRTASCTLRCSYCYQNAKQGRRMAWETLQAALDIVLRSDSPEVAILFYGGEPLLELPLVRRAVAHVAAARPAGKRVRYVLSTKGMLLDEEAAVFLAGTRLEPRLNFGRDHEDPRARGIDT